MYNLITMLIDSIEISQLESGHVHILVNHVQTRPLITNFEQLIFVIFSLSSVLCVFKIPIPHHDFEKKNV